MKIEVKEKSILIDDRYEMYEDGSVLDTFAAKDIPFWIFQFRDFVVRNYKKMRPSEF
jgi:hypothetical protein